MARRALVVVASTRAAAGVYEDTSGKLLVEWLRGKGFDTPDAVIVADRDIPAYVAGLVDLPSVLLTTGGTGAAPDDNTVDAIAPLIDTPLPGIAHAFWAKGLESTPFAVASRAVAGFAGNCFVMTLPGSRGGCKDGIAVLDPILDSLVGLREGDACSGPAHGCCHSDAPDPDYVDAQTGLVVDAFMTDQPLEDLIADGTAAATTPAMGAVVTFNGVVRDHDGGQRVASLTYSSHPSADQVLKEVAARVSAAHPKARLWAAHRTGALAIGESAFVVVAAAAHRAHAFAAACALADAVKAEVPIWKEQELANGSTQWVGLE